MINSCAYKCLLLISFKKPLPNPRYQFRELTYGFIIFWERKSPDYPEILILHAVLDDQMINMYCRFQIMGIPIIYSLHCRLLVFYYVNAIFTKHLPNEIDMCAPGCSRQMLNTTPPCLSGVDCTEHIFSRKSYSVDIIVECRRLNGGKLECIIIL